MHSQSVPNIQITHLNLRHDHRVSTIRYQTPQQQSEELRLCATLLPRVFSV